MRRVKLANRKVKRAVKAVGELKWFESPNEYGGNLASLIAKGDCYQARHSSRWLARRFAPVAVA